MATLPTTIKQERGRVLTAADLEKKYDLASIETLKVATKQNVDGLNKTNVILEEYVKAILGNIEDLQKQVDGNITTWFEEGEPTLTNKPASDWNTEALKANHVGDLYYNKGTGYGYRFVLTDGTYEWTKITDNDVVEALAIANAAKDAADGKRRVFTTQPVPPYDSGDLWIRDKELYVCQISKDETYVYAESDFIVATKYTDDTYAKKVDDKVVVLSGVVTEIKIGVDEWKVEVNSTFSLMDTEIKSAQTQIRANTDGINLKVDKNGIIGAINLTEETALIAASRIELQGVVTFASLASDVSSIINEAQSTANTATTAANNAMTIAGNAATTANNASTTANSANTKATNAQTTANSAKSTADAAKSTADTASANAATALATANAAKTTADANDKLIQSWCSTNDKTLINGAKIYTGSVTADKINVDDLFAQEITASNMNVDGGSVAGWDIVGKILKVSSGGTTSYWDLGTDISGSDSGTGAINFSTSTKRIGPGRKATQLSPDGTDFTVVGTKVSYDLNGVTVTDSNGSKKVMAFTPNSVYIPKLSTKEVHSNGTSYFDVLRANTIKTGKGADLDEINSNLTPEFVSASGGSISIATGGTSTIVASIKLSAGLWYITCNTRWEATNTTGLRSMYFTDSGTPGIIRTLNTMQAKTLLTNANGFNTVNATQVLDGIVRIVSDTTMYLHVSQTSGSPLATAYNSIVAYKISSIVV